MTHPVKEFIAKTRLTQNAFAVLHGISFQRLKDCLYGYTASIPQKIISVMIQNGYNAKDVQAQYLKWRRWKAEQELHSPSAATEGRTNP
ncbi:preprotein translocase subunit TatA [Paenibacillus sp. FSL R5-0527]|uniref:preprotein translocase subunit TatA n=1 Tax=Paenibacillus sp. FSL R5-0527 TaxID=2975321 RepID=UPI00097A8DE7|nr:preprotein translocase subunit TatA [Paenibacillus macerans]